MRRAEPHHLHILQSRLSSRADYVRFRDALLPLRINDPQRGASLHLSRNLLYLSQCLRASLHQRKSSRLPPQSCPSPPPTSVPSISSETRRPASRTPPPALPASLPASPPPTSDSRSSAATSPPARRVRKPPTRRSSSVAVRRLWLPSRGSTKTEIFRRSSPRKIISAVSSKALPRTLFPPHRAVQTISCPIARPSLLNCSLD